MPKRKFDPEALYQTIGGASRLTGLSQHYIRSGCKLGTVPHIMCGGEYRIYMPMLMRQLEDQAIASVKVGEQ